MKICEKGKLMEEEQKFDLVIELDMNDSDDKELWDKYWSRYHDGHNVTPLTINTAFYGIVYSYEIDGLTRVFLKKVVPPAFEV